MNFEEPQYFECACRTPEHTIVFHLLLDDEIGPELYMTVCLESDGLFKRIYRAIKYVLGYKSRYGEFAQYSLAEKDLFRMKDLLLKYEVESIKYKGK